MLILYKKSERQFLSNGIGRLDKHAFDDKVREELNGIYKLEFTYPIHAPHSKDIKNDNIVRATVPDGEQPFFISRIVKKDGYLRVTAYHLFYRLIWQLIEDINIVNLNGQASLNRVLENTEFTGVSDIATTNNIRIVRYNAVEAILNPGKDNTLISRFGGELKRDKLTVMLMNRIGRTYENNPVEIRYAKNLLSYEADISDSNVATRVMPIGFDGLLLPEKYVVKPGADPTDYKTVKVEYSSIRAISNPDSPKEGELPLEDAFEALRHAVLSDFESGRFDLKASYQVRFQELSTAEEYKNKSVLEKVYLGDEIKVIHTDEDLQILSRVIAYEWSPIRKEYEEVELGSHIETFSDIKPTLELIAGKVEQYKTDWESNVDEITELLTTALGGYVLKRSGELLIMDTEDPSTATKVWRWNLNGLAYSDRGINGPYETAITMDGRIIAKFIYALNLSSISANLGTVTAGRIQDSTSQSYWDLDNGEIVLNVKSLKINAKRVATEEDIQNIELTPGPQGPSGVSVVDTDVMYYLSSSATALVGGSWTTSAPVWESGKFIWSKTVTSYSNGSTTESQPVNIMGAKGEPGQQGVKGDPGISIISVTEYYLASSLATGVTTGTSGWTTTMQSMTVTNKYLWNYKKITYSDNSTSTVSPVVIGVYGNTGGTGATGRSLTAVTVYYLTSASSSGVTRTTPGWTTTMQSTTPILQYLWRYEKLDWSSGTTPTYIEPVIIGVHGTKGDTGTGIDSITEEYYLSTSKTTQTGGSWVTTPPTWSSGLYIWTRTKIVYRNPASTVYTTPIVSSEWEAVNELESIVVDRFEAAEANIEAANGAIALRALKTEVEATILKQATAPTHLNGRLWLDTSVTPNVLKRSTGSAWVKVTPTTGAEIGLSDAQIVSKVESQSEILAKKSEVQQVEDAWQASFGALSIGSKNYIMKSSTAIYTTRFWGIGIKDQVYEIAVAEGIAELELLNKEVVLSFEMKTASNGFLRPIRVYPYQSVGVTIQHDASFVNTAFDKWERFYLKTRIVDYGYIAGYSTGSVGFYDSAGNNSYSLKNFQLELGNQPTDWKPNPYEMYTGITRIDKDGVSVATSASDINSKLKNDGIGVYDGDSLVASFGNGGASVPFLSTNEVSANNMAYAVDSWGRVYVGNGYTFPNITEAFNYYTKGKARMIRSRTIVEFIVMGTIYDDLKFTGLTGDTIIIISVASSNNAKIIGNLDFWNCTIPIMIQGNGVLEIRDTSKHHIYCVNNAFVYFGAGLKINSKGAGVCFLADDGGTLVVEGCDIINCGFAMFAQFAATLHSIDNKGGGNNGPITYAAYQATRGGKIFINGYVPQSSGALIGNDRGFVENLGTTITPSSYAPPSVTSQTFTATFTNAVFDTLVHGTSNTNPYYGASAAQNRWDGSVSWCDGRIRFGPEIYNFFAGGSNIQVQIRLRRKNSSHGNSGAVMPAPYNHSASFPSGATRGGWTGWAAISSSYFTSGGADLRYYNGIQGLNGYAIWDAVEVWVSVTKNV